MHDAIQLILVNCNESNRRKFGCMDWLLTLNSAIEQPKCDVVVQTLIIIFCTAPEIIPSITKGCLQLKLHNIFETHILNSLIFDQRYS